MHTSHDWVAILRDPNTYILVRFFLSVILYKITGVHWYDGAIALTMGQLTVMATKNRQKAAISCWQDSSILPVNEQVLDLLEQSRLLAGYQDNSTIKLSSYTSQQDWDR